MSGVWQSWEREPLARTAALATPAAGVGPSASFLLIQRRISICRRLPTASAQDAARGDACQLAVIVFDLAIHDGEGDAFGEQVGLCEGGMVDDRCGIEDGDVCKIAGLQEAATVQTLPLGGERRDFADGGFKGHEVSVADVVS